MDTNQERPSGEMLIPCGPSTSVGNDPTEILFSSSKPFEPNRWLADGNTVQRRPGDLFLCWQRTRNGAYDWFHVGIVSEMHADHLAAIEGNTNEGGSPNGYKVCARTRGLAAKDYVTLG